MNSGQRPAPEADGAWRALEANLDASRSLHMRDLFARDPLRASRFSMAVGGLFADYSKHRVTEETKALLLRLAAARGLAAAVRDLFAGVPLNRSERRPALHTALRAAPGSKLNVDGRDIIPDVQEELRRVLDFAEALNARQIKGADGEALDTIVNIGIGGSDLGPRLAVDALSEFSASGLRVEFVANVDDRDLLRVLRRCNPRTTLFLVVSKSFRTVETRLNAASARAWLIGNGCADPARHFAAVTVEAGAARDGGIVPGRVFRIWDWVGGRYSLWSAAGLAAAVHLGAAGFRRLLAGARAMDAHFLESPPDRNLPVILGLFDVWYASCFRAETLAVVPYDHRLRLLPDYLSQLIMESNGKSVDAEGSPVRTATAPIVWGAEGTSAQHAFFQLLHQGTHLVPVDFLVYAKPGSDPEHHRQLFANCLAQGAALMSGREHPADPQRSFAGNRPSTTLLYRDLDPFMLGMLLCLYEHRTFVQAHVWGVNPFDQWGVELGKDLARSLAADQSGAGGDLLDSSTTQLLQRCRTLAAGDESG
jgi:glucose-6-phosphate isomerase